MNSTDPATQASRDPWTLVALAAALLLLLNLGALALLWRQPSAPPFEAPEAWTGHGEAASAASVEDAAAGIQRDLDLGWTALDRILEQRVRQGCEERGLDPEQLLPDAELRAALTAGGTVQDGQREAWLLAWREAYREVGLDPALLDGLATNSPESAAAP